MEKIRKINDGKDIAILCSGGVTKVAMNAANTSKNKRFHWVFIVCIA